MNKPLTKEILFKMFDGLRNHSLGDLEALTISCQILAWAKLSQDSKLPEELLFNDSVLTFNGSDLMNQFLQLSRLDSLDKNKDAFICKSIIDNRNSLSGVLRLAFDLKNKYKIDELEIPRCLSEILSDDRRNGEFITPVEVIDLMINLAGNLTDKRIYCPYDYLSQIASTSEILGAKASIENIFFSAFPWLMNIFCGANVTISISDPIRNPGFIVANKLEKFDVSISIPPFNVKYGFKDEPDWFNRFPEKTSSGNVLIIRHLLAQTTEKIIVAVSSSVLFSAGAEKSLREDLLNNRQVEAVISLPPALLSNTSIPLMILVLDLRGRSDTVTFIEGNSSQFFLKDGKGRSRLVNWELIVENLNYGQDEAVVLRVPVEQILANNSFLQVSDYTITPEKKKINRLLSSKQNLPLDRLVKFIRSPIKHKSTDNIEPERVKEVVEINVSDFPEYGYIQNPNRIVTIDRDSNIDVDTFLKPGDIIIAIKASTGKVAIVSDLPNDPKSRPWIVNQSCLILRSTKKINSKVLFMYLSSAVGQNLLQSMSSGSTISMIQLARLKELAVLIPSSEEEDNIVQDFDRMVELQSQIEQLRQEQKSIGNNHWGW